MTQREINVGELLDRIETLEQEVQQLKEDQRHDTETDSWGGFGDHRDDAILSQLGPGAVVTLSAVRKLYRNNTDITDSRTIKRRTKALLTDGPFEQVGQQRWQYTGGEDDE